MIRTSPRTSTPFNPNVSSTAASAITVDKPASTVALKASFTHAADALQFVKREYTTALNDFAKDFKAQHGRKPGDQDFPVEALRFTPAHPQHPPLVVLGGMGPLAGAQAFEAALTKFGDTREIVLLQQCDVPDRTGALDEDERIGATSDLHRGVLAAMEKSFDTAAGLLTTDRQTGRGHVVVACNTAHNFAPHAFERYADGHGQDARLAMSSMVRCVTDQLARTAKGQAPVVILGTNGTLRTRLYINPLEQNGVACAVPASEPQRDLMAAIYDGVKAFDGDATVRHGNALFEKMAAEGQITLGTPYVILAGCTEVPEIVNTLREHGTPQVKALLASATVADPMAITLDHVATLDHTNT